MDESDTPFSCHGRRVPVIGKGPRGAVLGALARGTSDGRPQTALPISGLLLGAGPLLGPLALPRCAGGCRLASLGLLGVEELAKFTGLVGAEPGSAASPAQSSPSTALPHLLASPSPPCSSRTEDPAVPARRRGGGFLSR